MNIERLHRVLIDLNGEITENDMNGQLSNLQSHLKNQVNNPQDPNHQKKLVETLNSLNEYLESSEFNHYSPSWKQIISEIGGDGLFGVALKKRIEIIFTQNQITPANAYEEIKEIVSDFKNLKNSIDKALEAFHGLNVGQEELDYGECELGYTIPRQFLKNKLLSLEKEIHELNFILNSISEAATGKKQNFEVKTISSSDFLLYIILGLHIGNIISKATERILSVYKNILEIKKLRNEINEHGVPSSKTKGIETHANSLMEKEINNIAQEIVNDNYNGENDRKNELVNAVTISLNKLANRIDKGFNVEIRVQPLPEPEETEESEAERSKTDIEKSAIINSIQKSARNIEYIKTEGESILKLPEKKSK